MAALAAALLLAAASPAAEKAAGVYEIDQMEMGGGLELRADGRFRYALEYGAVSEEAEGVWTMDGGTVRLTTEPMPPKGQCDRGFASACFDRTPLQAQDGELILWRWDAKIRFQPRPR